MHSFVQCGAGVGTLFVGYQWDNQSDGEEIVSNSTNTVFSWILQYSGFRLCVDGARNLSILVSQKYCPTCTPTIDKGFKCFREFISTPHNTVSRVSSYLLLNQNQIHNEEN